MWRCVTGVTFLLVVVGCRNERTDSRQAAASSAEKQNPADSGIETVDTKTAQGSSPGPVAWDYLQGAAELRAWRGLGIDASGAVWSYHYEGKQRVAAACDVDSGAPGECPYAGAQLVARLTASELETFTHYLGIAANEGGGFHNTDWVGPPALLTLPGPGTANGKGVLVASCFAFGKHVRQLHSMTAVYFIELLRRLRRSVRGLDLDPCGYVARNEPNTRAGVQDWFMP